MSDAHSSSNGTPVWDLIAADPAFAALKSAKRRFIIPATIFFMLFYMALPILVGYQPELMKKLVWGEVNIAYVFALSQFVMTWVICGMYVRAAKRWDRMNEELLAKYSR